LHWVPKDGDGDGKGDGDGDNDGDRYGDGGIYGDGDRYGDGDGGDHGNGAVLVLPLVMMIMMVVVIVMVMMMAMVIVMVVVDAYLLKSMLELWPINLSVRELLILSSQFAFITIDFLIPECEGKRNWRHGLTVEVFFFGNTISRPSRSKKSAA
jgi:hypothetical protein